MTHEEICKEITSYCNSLKCDACMISGICREVVGDFESHESQAKKAYELIHQGFPTSNVEHPSHYNREGGMECIDEMKLVFGVEAVKNFCLLNCWKYRYRAADKNGLEDLKKSDFYLKVYKELANEEMGNQ